MSNWHRHSGAELHSRDDVGLGDVAEIVEFSKLISMSSLGTPDAQASRIYGRKSTDRYLLQQQLGSMPLAQREPRELDRELNIAMLLELRGFTFEAELRYQRLAVESPTAASRLALMLEAKGFRDEAWRLYLHAAIGDDAIALFRLSVICRQRGENELALRMFRRGMSQLRWQITNQLNTHVGRMSQCRANGPLGIGKQVMADIRGADVETQIALGSFLYVVVDRPDLARLTYCSSLARGNSSAAVTLLETIPRPKPGGMERTGYLRHLLRTSGVERVCASFDCANTTTAFVERLGDSLRSPMVNPTHADLATAFNNDYSTSKKWKENALEHAVVNARIQTTLRGYANIGYEAADLGLIDAAAEAVCLKVVSVVADQGVQDGAELTNLIWNLGRRELASSAHHQPDPWTPSGRLKKNAGGLGLALQLADDQQIPTSGVVSRFGASFSGLSPLQVRVLTQRLSGQYRVEVAAAAGISDETARTAFKSAEHVLRTAQLGEQVPTSNHRLWQEVDESLSGFYDDPDLFGGDDDAEPDNDEWRDDDSGA